MAKNATGVVGLTALESRAAVSLALIFAARMLGLFLILPVFALYAESLEEVTPVLVGLAIGVYGLTQAVLQIPFGLLSDRIGRKPVIVGGLLLFALGSVVAALADNIYLIIVGRALQGSGAIAAAVMALLADLTRESHRTRAMAIIGMSIGVSFGVALVLGPLLGHWIGVPGIFWLTAALAVTGVAIVLLLVPTPERSRVHRDAEPVVGQFRQVLSNPELLRLDFGIMSLHMMMTSLFLAFPHALENDGLALASHWKLYLPVMVASMLLMVPFIIAAEKRHHMKGVMLGAILTLGIAQAGFWLLGQGLTGLVLGLVLFFTAFNLLEASLPSLVSKVAPSQSKGTAMGFYSSSQFVGAFAGGVLGGWVQHLFGTADVFLFGALAALVWFLVAAGMSNPRYLSNQIIRVGSISAEDAARLGPALAGIAGVAEAVVIPEDGVAYLKVDDAKLDRAALERFAAAEV